MSESLRNKNKDFFWNIVGPYCRQCGYNEHISSLQLHHLDTEDKESRFDSLGKWLSFSRRNLIKKIVNTKFTVLCSNCHIKLHSMIREGVADPSNPISNVVFVAMVKCMGLTSKEINEKFEAIDSVMDKEQRQRDFCSLVDEIEFSNWCRDRVFRKLGVRCSESECGFCGIEKLFPKENQE